MTSSAGPRIAIWGGKSLITPCRAQPWLTRYTYGSQTQKPKHFQDHSHFITVAGQLMRQILVDYARNSRAIKRGGGAFKLRLDAVDGFPQTRDVDFLRLDDALKNLREMGAQQRRLVEPRFLGGLSIEETAEVLGVSPATLKCRWTTAKAYLYRDMHH